MLIKQNMLMTNRSSSVKKVTRFALCIFGVCAGVIAPAAFASESFLVEKTVTVEFRLSELNAEGGVHKVYAIMRKRAASACRADRISLRYLSQSKKECVDDLMSQFVKSANFDALTTIHFSQKPTIETEKLALK